MMYVGNITIKPVRLSAERTGNNAFTISRDGEIAGSITLDKDRDVWWFRREGSQWRNSYCDSWRAAVLHITRRDVMGAHGRVVSCGACPVIRLQADTIWYTVIKTARGLDIFLDYPGGSDAACNPHTDEGIRLRRVRAAAVKEFAQREDVS